jgi:hypothetical protein
MREFRNESRNLDDRLIRKGCLPPNVVHGIALYRRHTEDLAEAVGADDGLQVGMKQIHWEAFEAMFTQNACRRA